MAVNIGVCGAYLVIGQLLRQSGFIQSTDTQVARDVIQYATLPSLLLIALRRAPVTAQTAATALGATVATAMVSAAVSWLIFSRRKTRERAALLGCSLGSAASAIPLALAGAAFGASGVQLAALCSTVNFFTVNVASYLFFGSAGAAFPQSFTHTDGGVYRGEWEGLSKSGLGTYRYPSRARYEGEWVSNRKDGAGIYYYPKGGIYKGEWREGTMDGIGVRVFASGKLTSGRWQKGSLVQPLPLSACATAVQAADRAAAAARQVKVGGGQLSDAAQLATTCLPFWAAAAGCACAVAGAALPPTISAVATPLAAAHLPLALMTTGAAFQAAASQAYQRRDVAAVLAVRLALPLLAAAAAAAFAPLSMLPLAVVLALLYAGPVAEEAVTSAHDFRLDDQLCSSIANTSVASSLLVSVPLAWVASTFAHGNVTQAARQPLIVACLAGTVAVLAAAAATFKLSRPRPVVRMVWKKDQSQIEQQSAADRASSQQANSPASGGGGRDVDAQQSPEGSSSEAGGQPPPPAAASAVAPTPRQHLFARLPSGALGWRRRPCLAHQAARSAVHTWPHRIRMPCLML